MKLDMTLHHAALGRASHLDDTHAEEYLNIAPTNGNFGATGVCKCVLWSVSIMSNYSALFSLRVE